jgi:hypothetical protein
VIVAFVDPDGDPIAVESESIVGLSILAGSGGAVTLVHTTATADRPFQVAAPFAAVLDTWTAAREVRPGQGIEVLAHEGVYPLVQHQYEELLHPSVRRPSPRPGWAAQTPPAKEGES